MVVVLPWHDPMRVAEQVVMLDHISNGRFIFGIGRGLGRVEFEGFGVNQEESRDRFTESAQMILEGLERGYCEYDGKYVKQTRRELRPAAVQVVPRPHLRRRRLARVLEHHGEARHRHPDHPAEAVGDGGQGARTTIAACSTR